MRTLFQRPHDYGEIFIDHAHMTVKGDKVIADFLFTHLFASETYPLTAKQAPASKSDAFYEKNIPEMHHAAREWAHKYFIKITRQNKSITRWLSSIPTKKFSPYATIGSIVMNCNPFTRGHLYLIEEALKKVEALYIFCVEEDRSFFSFADRFTMIKKGLFDV